MPLTICYRNAFFLKHCISPFPLIKKIYSAWRDFPSYESATTTLGLLLLLSQKIMVGPLGVLNFKAKRGSRILEMYFFVTNLIFSWDCAAVEEDCCMILRKDAAVGNCATSHSHVSGLETLDSANKHACCWRKIICIFLFLALEKCLSIFHIRPTRQNARNHTWMEQCKHCTVITDTLYNINIFSILWRPCILLFWKENITRNLIAMLKYLKKNCDAENGVGFFRLFQRQNMKQWV